MRSPVASGRVGETFSAHPLVVRVELCFRLKALNGLASDTAFSFRPNRGHRLMQGVFRGDVFEQHHTVAVDNRQSIRSLGHAARQAFDQPPNA